MSNELTCKSRVIHTIVIKFKKKWFWHPIALMH